MSDELKFKLKIPEAVTKYIKADAPKDARLMAAKGMVPMAPGVLATALTFLLQDKEDDVRSAAEKSLLDMPPGMVTGFLKDPAHPKTLDFFARHKADQALIIETVLLNAHTSDETFLFLADKVSERHATMIANNQVRLMRTPAIAETLRKNPNALRSVLDTMISFLRMSGVVIEGESAELTNDEIHQILTAPEPMDAPPVPAELIEELDETGEPIPEEKKKSLYQLVQGMKVAQKIKLALKGNKEARSLLIKDSNKVVASSVVKSPRITEGEIISIAQMRTAHDEVIRLIGGNPEWAKVYNLQIALANNPKTPFPIALKFARQLRPPDLQKLGKNKNVAAQLSRIARELYETKRK